MQKVLLEETGVSEVLVARLERCHSNLNNIFVATLSGVHRTCFHILQRQWVCIDRQAPSIAGAHAIGW